MSEPDWAHVEYDPSEPTNVGAEILGRGSSSRKSKTFIADLETSVLLALIRGQYRRLVEAERRLHARKHTRTRFIAQGEKVGPATLMELCRDESCRYNPKGEDAVGVRHLHEPEVLTDREIHERYPVTYEWLQGHQEVVDHLASLKGFSVRAASGLRDEGSRPPGVDSSAGSDHGGRRQGGGDGGDVKWR